VTDRTDDVATVSVMDGTIRIPAGAVEGATDVVVAIRAEQASLGSNCDNTYDATVEQVSFEGDRTQYHVEVPAFGTSVRVVDQQSDTHVVHDRGDEVTVGWDLDDAFVYPDEGSPVAIARRRSDSPAPPPVLSGRQRRRFRCLGAGVPARFASSTTPRGASRPRRRGREADSPPPAVPAGGRRGPPREWCRVERLDERVFVQNATASGIDDDRVVVESRQRVGVDHPVRLVGQRRVNREHVGRREGASRSRQDGRPLLR